MKSLTPEDIVRKRFPEADLQHVGDANSLGVLTTSDPGHWIVYDMRALGANVLGKGNTAEDAWKDAAEHV